MNEVPAWLPYNVAGSASDVQGEAGKPLVLLHYSNLESVRSPCRAMHTDFRRLR
jgi:hypothetical protein